MRKIVMLLCVLLLITKVSFTQDLSAKEKAEALAKNEFSKSKYKKKERDGVVKELNRVVESVPVIENNLAFYNGNYVYNDLHYKLEIRLDPQKKLMCTLSTPGNPDVLLENVSLKDGYFQAVRPNGDGSKEKWEGAFINKNDNGNTDFGLGIKLGTPIKLTEGLNITRIFFKKVSP